MARLAGSSAPAMNAAGGSGTGRATPVEGPTPEQQSSVARFAFLQHVMQQGYILEKHAEALYRQLTLAEDGGWQLGRVCTRFRGLNCQMAIL